MQELKGSPGSKGKVKGKARVVRDVEEMDDFEPGDILVTVATSPQWTSFMRLAAAIVTDIGGTLSHAAIVSREFGIPAVVGTKKATQVIKDGQTVEVDGNTGVVTVLE